MALFKKKKDEETEKASSSGNTGSRIAEAVRNLWNQTTAAQERAVRADMEQQRAQTQRVQEAARGLYGAYQRQTEQQARGQIAQQQARTERLRDAAEGLYSAYRKGREQTERAVRADMAQQQAQTRQVRDAARGLYSAYQQQTERAARDQMNMQRLQAQQLRDAAEGLYSSAVRRQQEEARLRQLQDQGQRELYARAADAADRTNELYRRQLAGTDMGAQADRLMTQPIMERADRRRSSLTAGDPDKGAGKYARVMENADFRANSLPKTDVRDETYNYINDLNDARARQQGYAAQRGADSGLEKYQMMTDEERGVYNYLYNTQGKTSAEGFLARLDPELNAQWYSGQSAWMSEQANRDTASRIGFTAATVGAQPVRTLSGAAALIDAEYRTATGKEIDPYNEFQKAGALTQDIRQIITAELEEKYPKKILGINAGDLYQDVCSALDSVINSQIAGFLAEGASALRGINDVKKINTLTSRLAGAFMSGQVAATSIAEGKKKGYSNIGATTLGLIRGGIEYLTEAIGGERVALLIRTQPGTLARAVVKVMGAEAIEEMASDIGNEGVNLIADSLFGADESFLRQTHEYFEAQGSENPWADTWISAMQQLYKSGMGGALSSIGSAAVYYGQTRATIKDTARQLNTDAKGVRSLMQEMKTDNPSAVQFLADVYEADSVEDLRAKVGQIESAEAAIDERMREIGRQAAGEEAAENRQEARISPEQTEAAQQAAQDIRSQTGVQGVQEGQIENETAPTERGAVDVNLEGPASDTAPTPEGSEAQTIISSGAETGIQGQSAREAARADRERKSYEQERRILETQSPERQQYLRGKRSEHADTLAALNVGDEIIPEGEEKPALRVLTKSENGMMVALLDENGQEYAVERVLPESFTGDQVISILDTAGDYRVANGQTESAAAANETAPAQAEAGEEQRKPTSTTLQSDADIEEENINDGTAAAKKLMEQAQTSDDPEDLIVRNAMYRSDLGPIDFRWGIPGRGSRFKGGYGLAHILAKRNAENGRGTETVNSIIEAIAKAKDADYQYSNNQSEDYHRVRLHYGDTTVVLSKEPGGNHWLLTGWENNETATNASGEVHDSAGATAATPTRTRRSGDAAVSDNSIHQTSENSNPQNAGDLRRQLSQAQEEYQAATEASDPDYDYEGQLQKIKELQRQINEADNPAETAGGKELGGYDLDKYGDPHPERGEMGRDGLRTCKDTGALEDELNDFRAAKLKNDSGEYFARIRNKSEGGVLLTIDLDGKRLDSTTHGSIGEAAAYARQFIDGAARGFEDAELDRNKSPQTPQQTLAEAMFTGKAQDEFERQKKNKAAEASTQTLRERIKKIDAELKALRRLEKAPGLTEAQMKHKADLQQSLEILNDELQSREGRARAKKETVEVKGNKPTQSTSAARREIMDQFHIPEGSRKELGDAIQQRLDEMLRTGKITEESAQGLFDALMDAGAVPKQADPTFREIRDSLSGRRIYVSEQERADLGDNWKGLYQAAWGDRILLTSNPNDMKIDTVNQELASVFGEKQFPTDVSLTEMLQNMLDKARKGRTTQQSLREAVADEAHYTDASPDEIYGEMYRDMYARLRVFGNEAGLEIQLKDKIASQLATERKRYEDRMEQQAQRRRESQIREKTLKALQRAEKLRGKANPEIRAQIDEILKDIDTHARQITMTGLEDLQALQQAYEDRKKAEGYVDEKNPGNFIPNEYVEKKLAALTQKHLNDMSIEEVIELGRCVQGIENAIHTQNQLIGEQFDQTVSEAARNVDADVKATKGTKGGLLYQWFKEEQLSPRRFLEMLGGWKKNSAMAKLADSLEKGQTRMLDFQRRAIQSMDPFMKKYKKWVKTASGKHAVWSTYSVANGLAMDGSGITGQTIEITPMMKISLYLHSLNNDNLRHIQTGGLVIPNKELYMKGKIKEAYDRGETVKMQPQAVRAIASTLTQEEKTFAGYLQKFFNTMSKDAINEVSVQLDGFERAGVDQYFPIESSGNFLASDVAGEARAQTVEGIGSIANERVHAGNPIMLSDAFDVFTRQVDKVSRYYGYAIPIRNFQAVNNYVFHEEGNAFAGSIKDTINHKWGSGAESYITKMLADLQSGVRTKNGIPSRLLSRLRSNLAGETLTLNPSVAISQAASYPGAAQVVGWDGLAAGLKFKSVDEKLIEKYTPLLWFRSQGYSTQEIGDAVSAQNKSPAQKLLSKKAFNWIQGMDRFTVKRLWVAAEYRVAKDNPDLKPGSKADIDAGTDPYYRKVAEVFNRAVYDTQPNYTDMERAQILRSEDELTKALTMFKTVPLQYYGMMTEAVGRLRAAQESKDPAQIREARKYAANTFGGLMAANSVYVAVKVLFKGFRKKDDDYRDEEGELTAASVGKQLGKDLMEVYAGSVIGGAEMYSIAEKWITGGKWNPPELSALSGISDIVNGIGSIFGTLDDGDPRKTARAVKSAALSMSSAMGLPVKNVETYMMAAIGRIWPKVAMEYDNLFGGIEKASLKGMDKDVLSIGAGLILRNRTGVDIGQSTADELSRLYSAGHNAAIPTSIPDSFSYGGNEVKIKDRAAYSDAWGAVVGDNLEELLGSRDYKAADDKTKAAMIGKLYQYATVQARMGADPEYSAEGNSTYGWTVKADEALDAGIDLPTAIGALTTFGTLKADKDSAGKTTVSKKDKVCAYIDALDIDNEQKDLLYELAGYTSGLESTPWHGGPGAKTGKITVPKSQEAAYKQFVDEHRKTLTESAAYQAADEAGRKALEKRLQEYAAVQAMRKVNPDYNAAAEGYGWTKWADQAQKVGISLTDAIGHMTALGALKADYDKYGKAITGSKKKKVCAYIDALHLTNDQKDALYLSVYKENSLKYTPWHGYKGGKKRRRGGRRGGRRRKASAGSVRPVKVGVLDTSVDTGIDVSALFGGGTAGKKSGKTSAGMDLLQIINKYYGGNPLAAAVDGGAKARTKVDFKL